LVEVTDYSLYALNRKMGYDTEIITDVDKKVITVDGKNILVKDFISISEEVVGMITAEDKKAFY
jgi:hypothetical protein